MSDLSNKIEDVIALSDQINGLLESQSRDVAVMSLLSVVSAYIHASAKTPEDRTVVLARVTEHIRATCEMLDDTVPDT